jgi:uncharacterized membrane protein YhfC
MDSVLRGLNAGLMIGLGLALGAWLAKRRKVPWGLFGIGAATFVASQVGHIPFNSLILSRVLDGLGWADMTSTGSLIGASALLGLSAGIFEEGARYLMYRFWAKKARSWDEALMIGAGHGGVEAILLGLLTVYALVQALALRGWTWRPSCPRIRWKPRACSSQPTGRRPGTRHCSARSNAPSPSACTCLWA